MFISDDIVLIMQEMATKGSKASDIISSIKSKIQPENFNYFFVMAAFQKAFDMRMPELLLLERAHCLGGGSFSDDKLNELLQPHLPHSR